MARYTLPGMLRRTCGSNVRPIAPTTLPSTHCAPPNKTMVKRVTDCPKSKVSGLMYIAPTA